MCQAAVLSRIVVSADKYEEQTANQDSGFRSGDPVSQPDSGTEFLSGSEVIEPKHNDARILWQLSKVRKMHRSAPSNKKLIL